ncbi:MAG: gliding motility-associated C-terminal domain-containing protein [Bacteroidales bacterium]|nr:gliding motility-associated C-terminal domain-containing protein [Bacteroidales bacterium]
MAGVTYTWAVPGDWTITSGQGTNSITVTVGTNAGNITVTPSNDCGNGTTRTLAVAAEIPPVIIGNPADVTICENSSAIFSITASGTNLTYQWQEDQGFGWIDLLENGTYTNVNTPDLSINNATAIMDGFAYRCVVSNPGCGSTQSIQALLTIYSSPLITSDPVDQTICEGGNTTFTVGFTGTNISFQWQANDGSGWADLSNTGIYTGAYLATLTLTGANVTYDGNLYRCIVSNLACPSDTSSSASLTVNTAPVIITQPQSIVACEGTQASFSVSATGAGLTYHWRKDGIAIPGATNPVYTISAVVVGDAGNYDVVISGTCGNITSNTVTLTVNTLPLITDQPDDVDECEGNNVNFTVVASGTGITYQWRKDGTDIPGETFAVLNLSSVTLADAGTYDVVVYGTCDTITSNPAVLTVYAETTIDIQPTAVTICDSSTATLSISASGYGALSYQWQRKAGGIWGNVFNTANISGANTSDLTINTVTSADTGYYRCVVTGFCNIAYSDSALIDINYILAAIGKPAPYLIDTNTTVINVSVAVSGRFLRHDLGIALVGPDGNEVLLKGPEMWIPGCETFNANSLDVTFSNQVSGTYINICSGKNITGTYSSEDFWGSLHGQDPANGGWRVRVYDYEPNHAPTDGVLTSVSITFSDTDMYGDTVNLIYNSGAINIAVTDANVDGVGMPSDYLVPMEISTSCFNTNDAEVVVTVIGGVAPFHYNWTGPTAVPDTNKWELGPGYYTVTVTDALGCQSTASVDVQSPPIISITDLVFTDSVLCYGATTGEIIVKANGGTGALDYVLMPGNIPSSSADSGWFNGLGAGTYTIVVTDINGCNIDSTLTIGQPLELELTSAMVTDSIYCNNDSTGRIVATATGGTLPYVFVLEPLGIVNDSGIFAGLKAGNYIVKLTDANSCDTVISATIGIIEPPVLAIDTVIIDSINCYGDLAALRVIVSGGTPGYRVSIDSMATWAGNISDTALFSGLTAGKYDIFVEDTNGCMVSYPSVILSEPAQITVDEAYFTDSLVCFGDTTGTIVVKASGGTGQLVYELMPGNITSESADSGLFTNLSAGFYTVVVTDEKLCTADTLFVIAEPLAVTIDSVVITGEILCSGDTTGGIRAYASGGTPPYAFVLEPIGAVNDSGIFANLPAGNYILKITDANSCDTAISDTISIIEPSPVTIDTVIVDSIACFGNFATLEIVPSGGIANYRVSIDSMATWLANVSDTATFTGLTAGNYYIFVDDANGCMVSYPVVTLTEPAAITIDDAYFSSSLSCFGQDDGTIVLKASGGSAPITFSITEGNIPSESADSALFTGLGAGTYTVRATDSRNCYADSVFTIVEPSALVLDSAVIVQNIICFGNNIGRIEAFASGGTAPYTFTIYPEVVAANTTGIFDSLPPGIFTISVTDANNCDTITSDTLELITPIPMFITNVITTDIACAGDMAEITVVIAGGTPPYRVSSDGGASWPLTGIIDTAVFTGLTAGNYDIAVEDNNGCQLIYPTVSITGPATSLAIDSVAVTPATGCYGDTNGTIIVYVSGGWGGYEYSVDGTTYQADSIFTNLGAESYTLYVRDSGGCILSQNIVVGGPDRLRFDLLRVQNVQGEEPGYIYAQASGGTPPYTYTMGTLTNTTGMFDSLDVGCYTIEVSDANNCTIDSTVCIERDVLDVIVEVENPRCFGDTAYIKIMVNDGTPAFELFIGANNGPLFKYMDIQSIPPFVYTIPWNVSTSMNFSLRIVDATGMTYDTTVSIVVPEQIHLTSSFRNLTCSRADTDLEGNTVYDGNITVNATGGAEGFVYRLYSYNSINNLYYLEDSTLNGIFDSVGQYVDYMVRVTDSNGCYESEFFTIGATHIFDVFLQPDTVLCKDAYIDLYSGRSYSGFDSDLQVDWLFRPDTIYTVYETTKAEYIYGFDTLLIDAARIKVTLPLTVSMTLSDKSCKKVSEMKIGVFPSIGMNFDVEGSSIVWEPDSNTIIGTEGNEFVVTLPGDYYFHALVDDPTVYYPGLWVPVDSSMPSETDSVFIEYIVPEYPVLYGIGITNYGCVEMDTLFIVNRLAIDTVYNVFTPNGDGVNDYFEFRHAEQYPEAEVHIYNRWGQLVYYQKRYNINDSMARWDGKSMKNGKDLPMGTYLYVITPNDGITNPITGTVTIVR